MILVEIHALVDFDICGEKICFEKKSAFYEFLNVTLSIEIIQVLTIMKKFVNAMNDIYLKTECVKKRVIHITIF